MEYYSAIKKNTFQSVLMRWMKLELVIRSEEIQKEKHQYSILTHVYGIQKDGNDNPLCETAKETQMYRTDFWTVRERERVGWFGRMALKHVYYHVRIESPVSVRCRIQHAWGWCTGMTQRDVMGRDLGGEFMFGNACTPMGIHVNVQQNHTVL